MDNLENSDVSERRQILKVVTHNFHTHHLVPCLNKAARMDVIIQAITEASNGVDILCVQELFDAPSGILHLKSMVEGVTELVATVTRNAAEAGLIHVARPQHEHDTELSLLGWLWYYMLCQDSGLMIFSRFPLRDVRWKLWRSNVDVGTAKGYLKATVDVPGGVPIDIYTCHFDAHSASRRDEQMNALVSRFRKGSETADSVTPCIVAGDFNMSRDELFHWVPRFSQFQLDNLFGPDASRHPQTFRSANFACDHIWFSRPPLRAVSQRLIDLKDPNIGPLSDHLGVWATIEV